MGAKPGAGGGRGREHNTDQEETENEIGDKTWIENYKIKVSFSLMKFDW